MSKEIIEAIEKYGLSKKTSKKTLFSKIGVIGCGKEGQNIVRVAAINGIEVVFIELNQERIDHAMRQIDQELDSRIEGWGMTHAEKKAILARIKGSLDYNNLRACDFVVETIRADEHTGTRSIEERKNIFKKVEAVVRPDAIIATNATTVVVTELASSLEHRERCISLHFFEASPEARLVEVVRGVYTSDETYEKVCQFVRLVRRDVIPVQESVGLAGVRLFCVQLNEACSILMEGVANKEDIDKIFTVGYGSRLGIFHHADIIGLEKIKRWMDNIFEEFGDARYKPSPLIKRLVRAKQTGLLSGSGFYQYDDQGKRIFGTDE